MTNSIDSVIREYLKKRKEVIFAYLFGSYAKGTVNKLSDIDIAIFVNPKLCKEINFGYRANLLAELMTLLHTNNCDLVILNYASPLLLHQVIRYGKRIFSRDEKKRVEFEVNSFKKYVDTKKLRDIQMKYVYERIGV
ncbi:MAG: nucleotidyltransferase domain-containing protein [bacterium]|nr:nucleotidyltransferase domain-containing protein [bacterium]